MKDLIAVLIIALVLGLAIWYIVRAKKNGAKCIGCPASKTCSAKSKDGSCCGCSEEK